MTRRLLLFLLLLSTFTTLSQPTTDDDYIRSDRLGIAHISTTTERTADDRYQQALALGAGWNRWPIYWQWAEPEPGEWDWARFDQHVLDDFRHGLQINAILIGRPEFYADNARITGMHEPIYADGTDTPGPEKALNPDNPWVTYVQQTVDRYRPDGLLAQQYDWPEEQGITVWEVWNEPDFAPFWEATYTDYARLLKISYIVIKQTDPNAQVMFGGLLYPTENNWLALVLSVLANDAFAEQNNWYMDIVAVHNYGDPWRSGWLTLYARETLNAYGLRRPIWLNETGIPTWDDYPGPTWAPDSLKRGTLEQQAWFLIQSATFAWSEGADKVFYHQLYDDCGDQPAGTDFPPHNGDLCRDDGLCFGDAFGMYRNLSSALCFSQHPQPGTPRPVTRAYHLLAQIFGTAPFADGTRVYLDQNVVTLTFNRPESEERISVLWNETTEPLTLTWPAVGESGQLITLDGDVLIEPDDSGNYLIPLSPAQPDIDQSASPGGGVAIGGMPHILIERIGAEVEPLTLDFDGPDGIETATQATPASQASDPLPPPARPTVDPATDTTPPTAQVNALLPVSPSTFTVSWAGQDNSGIERYLIWVQVNGGEWTPWLETSATAADYTGIPGNSYAFSAWAVDLAGNWSEGTAITAQASTQVE